MTKVSEEVGLYQELRELYERDPERFEIRRRQLIEAAIGRFPADRRRQAAGLQFRIDAAMRLCPNPVARMVRMSQLLWEQVDCLQRALSDPVSFQEESSLERPSARVIHLAGYRRGDRER